MSSKSVQFAIRDAVQNTFALYRREGLGACQDHDYLPDAQESAANVFSEGAEHAGGLSADERANEVASYVLAYTTSAEYIVAGLPSLH